MFNDKYKLINKIGSGGFSEIYCVKSLINNNLYAVKIENNTKNKLKHEYKINKKLKNIDGVINMYEYIETPKYNFIIMDLMNNDLEHKFIKNNKSFNISYILFIGLRILKILNQIHMKGIIHRDIKPHNFLLKDDNIYISDFGLSIKYSINNKLELKNKFVGSVKYASINMHLGIPSSYRDDLESLFYVLLYFIKQGNLPWTKEDNIHQIKIKKMAVNYNELIPDYPNLIDFIKYIKQLTYYDIPNYTYLMHLMFLK